MDNDVPTVSAPFFSIVVTTYNRAKLLKRALESLIAQTETDWEAILVDDGSTDDTYSQIIPYLKAYPKMKYIKISHSGEARSKNVGIKVSEGNYITFLDSDDEYNPKHLAIRKEILIQNPTVKFLYGGARIIGNRYVPDRFNYSKTIDLNDCVIGGTFFIDKNVLFQLNGFWNIPLGTDAHLFERAKEAQINMLETQVSTYIYHHETQDSITNNWHINRPPLNSIKH